MTGRRPRAADGCRPGRPTRPGPDLYDDILTIFELVFDHPSRAQAMSTAVKTPDGIVLRLAVPGRFPHKVFWTSYGPRIEAVLPHP